MSLTPTLLLACAEKSINTLLARDPAAPARLRRLAGKRLLLRMQCPRRNLLVAFHDQGLDLLDVSLSEHRDADATVEIDAQALGRLLGGESLQTMLFNQRLVIRGQTQLLEEARALLLDLDIDWEGALAGRLGDTAAHGLAETLRQGADFAHHGWREFRADLADYVFEEARLLPGRPQRDVVRDYLTELEIATDRLEARLARLQRKVSLHSGSST